MEKSTHNQYLVNIPLNETTCYFLKHIIQGVQKIFSNIRSFVMQITLLF